jgi:hypothetical protein
MKEEEGNEIDSSISLPHIMKTPASSLASGAHENPNEIA